MIKGLVFKLKGYIRIFRIEPSIQFLQHVNLKLLITISLIKKGGKETTAEQAKHLSNPHIYISNKIYCRHVYHISITLKY